MEVKKIVEGMTAVEVAEVIDSNFKNQNNILEEDIATQNSVIGVSEYKDFSEAEAVNVGDVRKYNGLLYECVEATTGAFDASKWKVSSFKAETEKKLSELGQKVVNISKNTPDVNLLQGFISIGGTVVQDENYKRTEPIKLKEGDSIVCIGFANAIVSVLSKFEDDKYFPIREGLEEGNKVYAYTASNDVQIVVSCAYIERWGNPVIYILENNGLRDLMGYINNEINIEKGKTIDIISKPIEQGIIVGEYVSSGLDIKELSSYNRTEPIPLKKGEEIYLYGYVNNSVSAITLCSEDGVPIKAVAIGEEKDAQYSFIAQNDCYVILSYANLRGAPVFRIKEQKSLGNLNERISHLEGDVNGFGTDITPNFTEGYYININEGVSVITSGAYSVTEPIFLRKGEILQATFSAQTNVIAISKTESNSNIEQRHHERLVVGRNEDLTPLNYEYEAIEDCYVEICFVTDRGLKEVTIKDKGLKDTIQVISDKINEIELKKDVLSVFSKVLFIGDSLTQGAYHGEPYISKIGKNFPNMFCRMGNVGGNNEGYSGIDSKTWWETKKKSSYTDWDLVILWLGTNNGLTDTLQEDVNTFSDYNDFADTNTGCYCKIIEDIKSSNPSANIVLLSCFASSGNVNVTNKVLKEISQKYDAPIFDTSWLSLSNDTSYSYHAGVNNVHLGIYGAFVLSKKLWEFITNYYTQNWIKLENGMSADINPTNWVYINR